MKKNHILNPQEIADLLEPAVMSCELHEDEDTPTGITDWKTWLMNQIEKYADNKLEKYTFNHHRGTS